MKIKATKSFLRDLEKAPESIKSRFLKNLELYLKNPMHPSLGVKKIKGTQNIWEMRISKGWRATFQKGKGEIILRRLGTHDIIDKSK